MIEIPAPPLPFALQMSAAFTRWAVGAILAVLIATALGRLLTCIMKLLTDAAIAFGQGQAGEAEITSVVVSSWSRMLRAH